MNTADTASLKILALESSGRSGSVGLLNGTTVVTEAALPDNVRLAAGLAPLLESQLAKAGWKPTEVDLVAVTSGPGSFTGLRVGTTTAKVFAYAAKAEVLGVDTLHAIALGCTSKDGGLDGSADGTDERPRRLSVVMDAQRKQLFCAEFDWFDGKSDSASLVPKASCHIVDADVWLAGLDSAMRVVGPGLSMKLADGTTVHEQLLSRESPPIVLPNASWAATPASVGRLAFQQYENGVRADLWKLVPQYHGLSYAEENAKPAVESKQ